MTRLWFRIKHALRIVSLLILGLMMIVSFQNCSSSDEGGDGGSSSATSTGTVLDNKNPPVVTSAPGNQTLSVGLEGTLSGTKMVSVAIKAHPGAGEPNQTLSLDCKSSDNRLELQCGGFNKDTAIVDIRPKDGQECFSGQSTITLTVEDSEPTNPKAPKLKAAPNTFKVDMVNTCLTETKIYANGALKAQDNFGEFVSMDGNYAAVAAVGDDTGAADKGAVNIYQLTGGQWQFMQKVQTSDGAASEKAGPISLRGGRLIVGSPLHSGLGGAAYIFELSGGTWTQVAKLSPGSLLSSTGQDLFGFAVDISGDWAAVGAYQYTKSGPVYGAGSVFIYQRSGGTWQFSQQIFSPTPTAFEQFGMSLDLESQRLVVGAPADDPQGDGPGAVYSYKLSGAQWVHEATVGGSGNNGVNNASKFGSAVAVAGNTLVIGAPKASGSTGDTGAAYAYTFDGVKWNLLQKLQHPEGAAGDEYGYDLAINSTHLVISARMKGSMNKTKSGSVYHYKMSGNKYALAFRIMSRDREARDYFGSSVDLSGSTVFVGSRLDDGKPSDVKTDAGSAYFVELK